MDGSIRQKHNARMWNGDIILIGGHKAIAATFDLDPQREWSTIKLFDPKKDTLRLRL